MVIGVFSSVSQGAIDFEYNVNLNRHKLFMLVCFNLILTELDSYLFSTSMAPFLLNTELHSVSVFSFVLISQGTMGALIVPLKPPVSKILSK